MSKLVPPPEPGMYPDVSDEEYRSWDCPNQSLIKRLFEGTPRSARYWMTHPKEPTTAQRFGTLVHDRVLRPDSYKSNYICEPEKRPDRRTKQGKAEWSAFMKSAEGREVVKHKTYQEVENVAGAVWSHPVARNILMPLKDGTAKTEIPIVHKDSKSGLLLKGKPDFWNPNLGLLADLKTTAKIDNYESEIAEFKYHIQAALYMHIMAGLGNVCEYFIHVVVEKTPPYQVRVVNIPEVSLEIGDTEMQGPLNVIARCYATGEWLGYEESIEELELPSWYLRKLFYSEDSILNNMGD